jgi:hypothetical protein
MMNRTISNGRNARTGNAGIEGTDSLNLKVTSLGSEAASPHRKGGRYPSVNLVHNGIWHYGTLLG